MRGKGADSPEDGQERQPPDRSNLRNMTEPPGAASPGARVERARTADALSGLEVLGCRLAEPLGRGASGTVYRARQLRLNRDVAVKLVPATDAVPGTASRFRREVRAIAALNHPNVVPLFDAGDEDGMLVLVMGLVQGEDLRALVRRRGRLDPEAAVAILRQIGSALDVAHGAGLVHRDVKPGNILVSDVAESGSGRAYLADFGLARSMVDSGESTVTLAGHWVGTPAYAAPEQRAGLAVGPAADRYALAGVLHFLLTGTHPGNDVAVTDRDQPTRRLLEVARTGMAEAPERRFGSAAALVAAAEEALRVDPVAGRVASDPQAVSTVPQAPVRMTAPAPAPVPAQTRAEVGRRSGSRRPVLLLVVFLLVAAAAAGGAWLAFRPDRTAAVLPSVTALSSAPASPTELTAAAPSASPTRRPTPPSSTLTWPSVARGDSGPRVRAVQLLLRAGGRSVEVDGFAGAETVAAVRDLQRTEELPATGSLDPASWERLARIVQRGDLGPAVEAVQLLLAEAGHDVSSDGRFGASTEQAVVEFQIGQGLRTDGVVGLRTWSELFAP